MGPQGDDPMCPCRMINEGLREPKFYEWSDEKKTEFAAALDLYETEPSNMKIISVKFTDITIEPPDNKREITIPVEELGDGMVQLKMTHEFLQDIITLINLRSKYSVKIT
jgi:hypothetical protein